MSYKLEFLDEGKILSYSINDDYNEKVDAPKARAETRELLDGLSLPVYGINDFRGLQLTFEEIIEGAAALAAGDNALWKHPNLKKIIIIVADAEGAISLSAKGMTHDAFGNLNIEVVGNMKDALALCE